MATTSPSYWKRIWCWVTSQNLTTEELAKVLDIKDVKEELKLGLTSYKPFKTEAYTRLQTKYPDQTVLLSVVKTLQSYIDVDSFQTWEVLKHYLCDISYGTPASALKNVAFVDTRPTFLLPNVWKFYYSERLFLLKLLQYILENKDNDCHKYNEQFHKIVCDISLQQIKTSLLAQFDKVLSAIPPPRRIQNDFSSDTIRTEWAQSNLREQLTILQCLLLVAKDAPFTIEEFTQLFEMFRKHGFGRRQGFNDLLEEKHRVNCLNIMYMEICLFMVILDSDKIANASKWIEKTKLFVEGELTKLQMNQEHSAMLITWMMLTLQSEEHAKQFETHYQHFGATALKMRVFEFFQEMIDSPVFSDKSHCALIGRRRTYALLSALCDKFDTDGSLGTAPGVMRLCGALVSEPGAARQFWAGEGRGRGAASLWSSALEYFPMRFGPLSVLAEGLARAGKCSARNLLAELKNLPVYTEPYNPALVPVISLIGDDAVIGRAYCPAGHNYLIEAGARATITEQKEGTYIHFRTPYSYWDVFNSEIEKALDRKGHHQYDLNRILEKVYEGTKVLEAILTTLAADHEVPPSLVSPSEGVFDILVRFMKTDAAPLPLLVACLRVATALAPAFPHEIHSRLINTGLLPRTLNHSLTPEQYAAGASFDSAAVGLYLVAVEQPRGSYDLLMAYIDLLSAFLEAPPSPRLALDVLLPGVTLLLRDVLPGPAAPPAAAAARLLAALLQRNTAHELLPRATVLRSLHYSENATQLLKIVAVGNPALEQLMFAETNWSSGAALDYVTSVQRAIALLMLVLRQRGEVAGEGDVTPLEQLIFAHGQDTLKVVPRVAGCINNVFNTNLSVLCCRLLKKFAESFQMSLFASLDMTAYQVRVMFLERLRDQNESASLKVAILEFVATCVGKQPGLTEAFFKMNHATKDEPDKDKAIVKKETDDDSFEGILGYMADYLGTVKADAKLLHSPLLACIMELFHALWKNNMQILVRQLRENPKFWDHISSPLFSDVEPGLRTYAQIFNVLGIELFLSRDKIEPNLKEVLETFFDTNKPHLDTWINHIYSFSGRSEEEAVDKVPAWLGLLTSWKDFTTIFCKCLPLSLNIAHKTKMVQPCMTALLHELEEIKDSRLVVILAELYVIMLANWKDDCFDNRKANAKNIDNLLTNTAGVYESLHPRAKRAILSIGTMAISSLDYKIKANSSTAQNIIRSVTNINSLELSKLFDDIKDDTKTEPSKDGDGINEDISPVVLSLALLEQCLDLYDETFTGLSQWFQASRFTNKLLCCLQGCLQNRRHYHTSLAALRCLTAYCRGPFSKDLLLSDIDQFLWLQLLPPKFDNNTWKVHEWWKVYVYSLDFISMMVLRHGQFFVGEAITFVGVHLDHLVEAILLPRQLTTLPALDLCAATLKLLVQLCRYEARWQRENANSMNGIVRSVGACLQQCVSLLLRARRPADAPAPTDAAAAAATAQLHSTLEILHMSTLCLLAFSPDLLSLLADPALDLEGWPPLVDLDFGASEDQLTFGTLLTAVCLLTKSLNHSYHSEEAGGSRSPRARRRVCSCSSPAERRAARSESLNSISSGASVAPWLALNERLVASALEAVLTLLAGQALLFVRSVSAGTRAHALVRRELGAELSAYHEFVRARVLCAQHARPHLARNKLGSAPLAPSTDETQRIDSARRQRSPDADLRLPPPPPPKRASHDNMREYILRKHYLDKCAQTPTKDPPSPVSHSTPTSDKKKDSSRSSKRVSWAEPTRDEDEDLETSLEEIEPVYSNLTDVQINNDEDYFHFMSVVFLCICQMDCNGS